MQLSLSEILEPEKKFLLDIFAELYYDEEKEKYKLNSIKGHNFPADIQVKCPQKYIKGFADGTIFKLDIRIIKRQGKKMYFSAINRKNIQRALEFFDYNLKVQNGFDFDARAKQKVILVKPKKIKTEQKSDIFETF